MSKTRTAKDLKTELGFIPDEAEVSCRNLGYGYQLVFDAKGQPDIARIFIRRKEEGR